MINLLLRGWNWCCRFRHRCGYGVHSPSDFYLITFVAYEKLPFYAYKPLHARRRAMESLPHYREKVDKFIFRLTNHLSPLCIWEFGTASGLTTLYMAKARQVPVYTCEEGMMHPCVTALLREQENISIQKGGIDAFLREAGVRKDNPGLIHLGNIEHYQEVFEAILPYTNQHTCLIIGNPHQNKEKKEWWKKVISDPRVGVTFDFYDIGLVFFDRKRVKEHRIVNFL